MNNEHASMWSLYEGMPSMGVLIEDAYMDQ